MAKEMKTRSGNDFIDLKDIGGAEGRGDGQFGWMLYFGKYFSNKSILDVGAGLGHSRERLSVNGNTVTLQDTAPDLPVDIKEDISTISSKSYDIVTCFDVIEHIPDDYNFLKKMHDISREGVVISTPNFMVTGCKNEYHIREYTPRELYDLCMKVYVDDVFPLDVQSGRGGTLTFWITSDNTGSDARIVTEEDFLNEKPDLPLVYPQTDRQSLGIFLKRRQSMPGGVS